MKPSLLARAILAAGCLVSASAFATTSEVHKCVTPTGHVTLTDEACPAGTSTVKIISGPPQMDRVDPAVNAAVAEEPAERYTISRMPSRYVTLMHSPKPARGLSLDVATLKQARASLQALDSRPVALRAPRVAGLR